MLWFFSQEAHGILAPQPGIKPATPELEGKLLTTGLPRKAQCYVLVRFASLFSLLPKASILRYLKRSSGINKGCLLKGIKSLYPHSNKAMCFYPTYLSFHPRCPPLPATCSSLTDIYLPDADVLCIPYYSEIGADGIFSQCIQYYQKDLL